MMGRRLLYLGIPLAVICLVALQAFSAPQGREQRQCIETMNGNGAKVGKTQGKDITSCVRSAGLGGLGPLPLSGQLDACLIGDSENRVFKIKQRAVARESKRCISAVLPEFGVPALVGAYDIALNNYSNVVNPAAIETQLALAHDILGLPADNAVINASTNRTGATCQRLLLSAAQGCVAEKLKVFNRCKKQGLKDTVVGSAAQLEGLCLSVGGNPATGQPDPKASIAKRCTSKFASVLVKKCTGVTLSAAFPGICGGAGDFGACIAARASCRTCQQLNRTDNLNRDCDLFDDSTDNNSCPNTLPECGDGIFDAGGEECDDGNTADGDCCSSTCQAETTGTPCGDATSNSCTAPDTCNAVGVCQPNHVAAGSACGSAANTDCTNPDTCDGAGACQANDETAGTTCGDPSNTDCTNPDTCNGTGTCQSNHETAGTTCGSPSNTDCTNPDTCDASGVCQPNDETPGTTCTDDGNACTSDTCDASATCVHTTLPAGSACGDPSDTDCSDPDTCDASGVCQPNNETPGAACPDDGVQCTSDTCNASGACTHATLPNGSPCGSPADTACSDPDTCQAGTCQPNNSAPGTGCTSDGNQCTDDLCDGAGTCTHPNSSSGTPCADDGSECTNDTCNGGGSCTHPPKIVGTPCTSDGNGCTDDVCNGSGACAHQNNSAPCNDGTFCNGGDTCSGGACSLHAGNPCPGPDGDNNCQESCNEASDNCTAADPNGSACNDSLSCNGADTCSGGSCSGHAGVCCGSQLFTFTVNSNSGGVFDSAEWPGGQQSQNGAPGCNVTINNPNNNIDLVCTLAGPFSVAGFNGFSNCFGTGGEDGDGCQPVFCPPAGIGSCCSTRPSCSAALNGSGQARYFVQCVDP